MSDPKHPGSLVPVPSELEVQDILCGRDQYFFTSKQAPKKHLNETIAKIINENELAYKPMTAQPTSNLYISWRSEQPKLRTWKLVKTASVKESPQKVFRKEAIAIQDPPPQISKASPIKSNTAKLESVLIDTMPKDESENERDKFWL